MNDLWRADSDWIYAYTEDKDVMRRIKRYYPDFMIMAEYYQFDRLIGVQYKVPSNRKRSVRRLLGINVGQRSD